MKCGNCENANFERTPTGRIRANTPGQCAKAQELIDRYSHQDVAPCIVVAKPHRLSIWPDYDATHCPLFSAIK